MQSKTKSVDGHEAGNGTLEVRPTLSTGCERVFERDIAKESDYNGHDDD